MSTRIAVRNPSEQESCLADFSYSHIGCSFSAMQWHRNSVDSVCTIRCGCGLSISFPQFGTAVNTIFMVSVDGEPRELPSGLAESPSEVTIVAEGAG